MYVSFKRLVLVAVLIAAIAVFVSPLSAQQAQPNLVVIVRNTPVLGGPGGSPTSVTLRACQTFFLREVSSDGRYVRLNITNSSSVWVDATAVQDVAENYGQRNGAPATCSGVPLAAPTSATSVASTPAPTPVAPVASPTSAQVNTRITPNLVLVNTNSTLSGVPGGGSIGVIVRTCQTFFAVEISADRQFYRLQITPSSFGWITANNVQDVAENYGQRNGEARVPGC
ncbi:MAG: hypothetical protein J0M33_09430 [Anaerolineae bacterium]|nr:hypothetical protein [Anaerolineae bacterium]